MNFVKKKKYTEQGTLHSYSMVYLENQVIALINEQMISAQC